MFNLNKTRPKMFCFFLSRFIQSSDWFSHAFSLSSSNLGFFCFVKSTEVYLIFQSLSTQNEILSQNTGSDIQLDITVSVTQIVLQINNSSCDYERNFSFIPGCISYCNFFVRHRWRFFSDNYLLDYRITPRFNFLHSFMACTHCYAFHVTKVDWWLSSKNGSFFFSASASFFIAIWFCIYTNEQLRILKSVYLWMF